MGNPPYLGARLQSVSQKDDQKLIWNDVRGSGTLDYVTNWFIKAAEYMEGTKIRAAFVSTNSISQGGQPAILWNKMHALGAQINFAYRTFNWENSGNKQARSEEHTSELQSLMRISYAVFCLKKKNKNQQTTHTTANLN